MVGDWRLLFGPVGSVSTTSFLFFILALVLSIFEGWMSLLCVDVSDKRWVEIHGYLFRCAGLLSSASP